MSIYFQILLQPSNYALSFSSKQCMWHEDLCYMDVLSLWNYLKWRAADPKLQNWINIVPAWLGGVGVCKGVVCGPEGARFADNRVLTKLRKCHLFLPSPIYACPCHGPWATSLTAKTWRGAKQAPDALVGASQLRETTPTENIGPPGSMGVGRRVDNSTPDKKHCHDI